MNLLDGKVALISGGTKGIGLAIAAGFVAEGARVVINGRNDSAGLTASKQLGAGERVHFIAADVSDPADCDQLVDEARAHFGRLHILVNNAGAMVINRNPGNSGPVHTLNNEAMEFCWKANVMSTFCCSRRAIPVFREQQWGRIINISSTAGKIGYPGVGPYVATKHAVNGLTKTIAAENATLGITSNAICAGSVETEMMRTEGQRAGVADGISYEDFKSMLASYSLIKRLNTVEEISVVATWLASEAGGGVTGQCINVDGGTVLSG